MSIAIDKSRVSLKDVLENCGYKYTAEVRDQVSKFSNGDDNQKSEILKDLLSQIAYAGANFLLKCIVKFGDKIDP